MNTYKKYCPNVYVAKCEDRHEKGEVIPVETRNGKVNDSIVYNLVAEIDGFFYYSIVRDDGFNIQERARRKAERFNDWAGSAELKSDQYYERSNADNEFLSLGEPIKVGHNSEKWHRKTIKNACDNMYKCVEFDRKSKQHLNKAKYWEGKENDINLSMPKSIDFYRFKMEEAKNKHEGLKEGTIPRTHSYSLTYAKKALNTAKKHFETSQKLWGE